MNYHALALFALLSVASAGAFAAEPPAAEPPVSDKEIRALIEQLASPNAEPEIVADTAEYPKGFDHAAQDRVFAAWQRLFRIGYPAFPHWLESMNDGRYSFTRDAGAAEDNWDVGRACWDLLRSHLQPYGSYRTVGDGDPRERPYRPSYISHHKLYELDSARLWWAKRKGRTLRELQIETLEWIIAEEAKTPADYSDEERRYLREVLAGLLASDKPLQRNWPFPK